MRLRSADKGRKANGDEGRILRRHRISPFCPIGLPMILGSRTDGENILGRQRAYELIETQPSTLSRKSG
jgi:hypothetical protein